MYRETTDPKSAEIELLNPMGAEHPYYAEFGWTAAPGIHRADPGRNARNGNWPAGDHARRPATT